MIVVQEVSKSAVVVMEDSRTRRVYKPGCVGSVPAMITMKTK